jgi:hypothetical protein
MLAVAAVVAMLANLVTREQWWRIFSGQTTHHFVIVDDSLSMADQRASESAFGAAQRVVSQIITQAARQTSPQRLTLIRATQASLSGSQSGAAERPTADLVDQIVDSQTDLQWEELRRRWDTSDLGIGMRDALEIVAQQASQVPDQRSVVYVISDFRQHDWQQRSELGQSLAKLRQSGCQLHAIRCVDQEHENLALVSLDLAEGTVAAGVPMFAQVGVRNYGTQVAEQVELTLRTHWYANQTVETAQVDELPQLIIDRIEPGETVIRQAQVFFPSSGQHVVEAQLPNDVVRSDNRRWMVVNLPDTSRVLIVDGDAEQRNVFYLQAVFQPGERAITGVLPDVQSEAFLHTATAEQLADYDTIYLLDLPSIEPSFARLLDEFVRQGGGLAMFLGPDVDLSAYNRLASEQQLVWIPVLLSHVAQLPPADRESGTDVIAQDNPIFRVLASRPGQPNPFARSLRVQSFVESQQDAQRPEGEVLAQLRDGSPLVIEQLVGRGRVVTWLTTLAPIWNNWAYEPTFPVVLLQQQARLASGRQRHSAQMSGTAVKGVLDVSRMQRSLEVVLPPTSGNTRMRVRKLLDASTGISQLIDYQIGVDAAQQRTGETDASGVYDVVRSTLSGDRDIVRYALNPDASDGQMELVPPTELAQWWGTYGGQLHEAVEWTASELGDQRESWSQLILIGLVGALVLEQLFAYACSYHIRQGARA